jgi:hypothetical protein
MSKTAVAVPVIQAHRSMVAKLAKPGQTILEEISPVEAHLLHMLVIAGDYGEVVGAHRRLNQTLDAFAAVSLSPLKGQADAEAASADVNMARGDLLKECGDFTFYLVGIREGLELPDLDGLETERTGDYSHRLSGLTASDLLVELVVVQGDLIDAIKRVVIYRKGYPKKGESKPTKARLEVLAAERAAQLARAAFALDQIEVILGHLFDSFGYTYSQVLQANIDKLTDPEKGRYTSGSYSDTAAVERNDVKDEEDDLSQIPAVPPAVAPSELQQQAQAERESITVEAPAALETPARPKILRGRPPGSGAAKTA